MSDAEHVHDETAPQAGAEQTPAPAAEPAAELVPDARLLESHDLARAALLEITPEATIGDIAGYVVEGEHLLSLRFENRMLGYPGWLWTVTLARVDGAEPTVLEAELMPADGALLAPEWVPWAVRLAEYQAAQAAAEAEREAAGEPGEEADEESDGGEHLDELDELDDIDEDDFETDGSATLHSGDLDGVDIDEDDSDSDDEDDSDDDDDDDDDDSDDDDEDDDSDDDEDDSDDDDEDDSDGDDLDDADDPEGIDRSY